MAETQNTLLGTDTVPEAYPKVNTDIGRYYLTKNEVEAARDGETDLLAKNNAQDDAISALAAGSGVVISANDTTVGFLNGKMLAGSNISLTENNDGGDETLTVASTNEPFTTSAKTADYQILASDLNGVKTFTNTAAIAAVNLILIEAIVGYKFSWLVDAAQYLKCTAFGTNTISYGRNSSAAGGYVRSNNVGTFVTMECLVAGKWTITKLTDILNYDQ